ncbi:M17 family metallopeptidase [Mycoplasma phocimorsus]|uniref:Probable cytosol aminopeptidase n=1 Tax=Mycoplasma phocimorsus TaxID=3045839 RepID=A0AAJ1PSI2_9MOLU|nr:M17 family metallopeptidase [Mycoplasma phocimorsus]MDJ1645714.1 M17 family metallopeptidase [Mycoplasma phocimorsus]MDJ1646235.1 M17 family metallopeptidase [Mycoplasma phocimorsus]MDJ1646837.1 M17 family metallopeptidase [Mycoplasma phocimorsus]MDJ1648633.1 M17 family metallopeptidase [Mycoplasma phocimorsus]
MKIINQVRDEFQLKLELVDKKIEDKYFLSEDYSAKIYKLEIEKEKYNYQLLYKTLLEIFPKLKVNTALIVDSFISHSLEINEAIKAIIYAYHFSMDEKFLLKKESKQSQVEHFIFTNSSYCKNEIIKTNEISKNITWVKNLQVMPPNICTSTWLAQEIVNKINNANIPNLNAKYLDKKQMKQLGMNLILSVNKGSSFDARLVVIDYSPNPDDKQRLAYVGKGITFDSGGYNIKTGKYMLGMKFDMSGAAICAGAIMSIASLKGNKNVSAILPLTDNRLNNDAISPDMVIQAMNGLFVEIENTDAEGRLVLADGITYAEQIIKADTIVDVATLTGAIVTALGRTYSGIWSTNDEVYSKFEQAANAQHELIWRMPMHDDFQDNNLKTNIADIKNCSEITLSDCNDAAMYLSKFREKADYIHCDIAGSAKLNNEPQAILLKTLVEFGL